MFSPQFLRNILEAESGEYISVRDISSDQFLDTVFRQLIEQNEHLSDSEETVNYLLEVVSHIFVKFPKEEEQADESLLQIDPRENLESRIEDIQGKMLERTYNRIVERANENFPIFVDIFQVKRVTFAYQITEKEETLSRLMDRLVGQERYEEAAKVRDALDEIGSDKIID